MSAPMRQAVLSEVANSYKDQSFLIFFDAKHDIDVPFLENMARLIHGALQLVVTLPYRYQAVDEAQDAMLVNFSRSLSRFRESVKQLQEIHQQVSSTGPVAQPGTPTRPEPAAARPQQHTPQQPPVKAAPVKHGRDSDSDSDDDGDESGAQRGKMARKGE